MIRYLYCHGRFRKRLLVQDRSLTMGELVDVYLLADKYDVPGLRQSASNKFRVMTYNKFRFPSVSAISTVEFVDCIARVCGPDSLQSADGAMRALVIEICQKNSISLLQNNAFVHRYTRGELFDLESATAFGMELGDCLLKSKGYIIGEAGVPKIESGTKDAADRYVETSIVLGRPRLAG